MARIKYVINERRLAYEGAVQIMTVDREREALTRRERTAARRKSAEAKKVEEQVEPAAHRTTAETAAAGLVQPDLVQR